MFLCFSSLLLSFIVYYYCCDDETRLIKHPSTKEGGVCLRSSRHDWLAVPLNKKKIMSYGTWLSPINSSLVAENARTPTEIQIDSEGNVYWLEHRSSENGRYAIRTSKKVEDVIDSPYNSRTRVHEYGGGSYIVTNNGIYFTNFADQRIYHVDANNSSSVKPITDPTENVSSRYANFAFDSFRQRLICVHEYHENATAVHNTIVAIPLDEPSKQITLDSGYDFYASPKISPDGKYLVWLCWNHPNMPWDETELWIGEFNGEDNITLINKRKLCGTTNESILQPKWSVDGKFIYFISDRSNWWNIYRTSIDGQSVEHVCNMEAEFGGPSWQFDSKYYDFDSNGNIVAVYWNDGITRLVRIDVQTKQLTQLSMIEEYTDIRSINVYRQKLYFIGSSAVIPTAVVEFNLETQTKSVLLSSSNKSFDSRYLSVPEKIKFPTGDDFAYGFYYKPKNGDYETPSDELPPLLVRSHGGPTSATTSMFNLRIQYWTSRGYALLDVNYRGSSGYGRKFRDALRDKWGIYDVEDCIAGAEYLVQQKKADKNRLAIDGGSAGGYTTLCALTMHNYFTVGASHYGVADLELLAQDTHKFESRYLDRLIGEYPAKRSIYIERAPITHVQNLSKPIIFFQGSEDKIVLPNQAELMVNALRDKKLPVSYVLFEGEQHGFRKAENIKRCIDLQFYFFSKIFRFEMADKIEPIPIENLGDDHIC